MGKSLKPLKIAIHPALGTGVAAPLVEKGHEITFEPAWDCDLILAPNAARFLLGMEKFLDAFIKGARALRYPKEPR